jgi:hypothetical protein
VEIPKLDTSPDKLISESFREYAEALDAYFMEVDKKLKVLMKEYKIEFTN